MQYVKDITVTKRTLFDKKIHYNKLNNITDENISKIKELIPFFEEYFKINTRTIFYPDKRGIRFIEAINYCLYNFRAKELTFDEKMLFLILSCDPECKLLYNYENASIMSKDDVLNAEIEEERNYLNSVRKTQIEELRSKTRSEIGFFETELIGYERDYVNKILNKFVINTHVGKDKTLYLLDSLVRNKLDLISEEDFKRINDLAMLYISSVGDKLDNKVVTNSILYQNNLLKLKSNTERTLFFLLVLDPDLITYQLYEEYSNTKYIEPLCKSKIGFFDLNLVKLEKQYHKLYCPQKFISEWTI